MRSNFNSILLSTKYFLFKNIFERFLSLSSYSFISSQNNFNPTPLSVKYFMRCLYEKSNFRRNRTIKSNEIFFGKRERRSRFIFNRIVRLEESRVQRESLNNWRTNLAISRRTSYKGQRYRSRLIQIFTYDATSVLLTARFRCWEREREREIVPRYRRRW